MKAAALVISAPVDIPFFTVETVRALLEQEGNLVVRSMGSVREACERTGISYSKGWSIIQAAERELGYGIVERQLGNGGRYPQKFLHSQAVAPDLLKQSR